MDETPDNPNSMTYFFHLMSGGDHLLMGEAHDQVVTLPDPNLFPSSTELNLAAIDSVDAHRDLSVYDYDGDGVVDFLFVVYRQKFTCTSTQTCQCTPTQQGCQGNPWFGGTSGTIGLGFGLRATMDNINVDGGRSALAYPPARERGFKSTRTIAIHEYTHHLGVSQTAINNGGPYHHIRSLGGYCVQDGTWGAHEDGTEIMSTFLRWKLDWLDPPEITLSSGQEQTYTLSDVGESGASGCLLVHTTDPYQHFLLECRDSTAAIYDNGNAFGCDDGARGTSGLLIGHVSDRKRASQLPISCQLSYQAMDGWWITPPLVSNQQLPPVCPATLPCVCDPDPINGGTCPNEAYPPNIDIEVATGMFDSTTWAPDPVYGWDALSFLENANYGARHDDLFRPGVVNLFTPYTNPSTNLYYTVGVGQNYDDAEHCGFRQDQNVYSGLSFYNIDWETTPGGGNGEITVTIRYDGTPPAAGSPFTLPDGMVWSGLVQLVADVEVPAGRTLTISQKSQVVSAANQDSQAAGESPDGVQIGVKGQLLAGDLAGGVVEMTSSRDLDFVHFAFDSSGGEFIYAGGEATVTAGSSDWSGLAMDLIGAEWTGYGCVGSEEPLSDIENTSIENATYGIRVQNLIAPNLAEVDFVNIGGVPPKHIYLDNTDAFIPWGVWNGAVVNEEHGEWDLLGGTYVVATNTVSPSLETSFGVGGKVDLVPQGKIFTTGSTADGDTVYFRPETLTNTGDGWGGILLDVNAAGSVIEYADIGYAENPVFLFIPDGATTIRNCRIHDFADVGIAVSGTTLLGGIIESNTIERGGVLAQLGLTGILLDSALNMVVRNNKIDLSQLALPTGSSAAIDVTWATQYCWVRPWGAHVTLIEGNWIVGPGTGAAASHSGIRSTWTCAAPTSNITVTYLRNYIEGFNLAGIELVQTSNVQADSNNVVESFRAIDVGRDANPVLSGPAANFRANWFEVKDGAGFEAVRSNNRAQTKLGMEPSVVDRGNNGLMVERSNVEFLLTYTEAGNPILEAQNCYWYTFLAPSAEDLINLPGEVIMWLNPKLKPNSALFDHSPRYTSDATKYYHRMLSPPQVGRMIAGPPSIPLDGAGDRGSASGEGLARVPAESFLGAPSANPARDVVQIQFGVAAGEGGAYVVDIFDVRGRHVRILWNGVLAAGTRELSWDLSDDSGRRVSSGVYFLRMAGVGFAQTQKIVLVK
ncbi:MAG: right-handed parallel beta-helix repeat-containing protein [Candidatus Eiseniibacteriota bacterium]